MENEKGQFQTGVKYEGIYHKDFELRPALVRDSIEIEEEQNPERLSKNRQFKGICLLTKQITKLGDIPPEKITPDMIMDLLEDDGSIIINASKALESRLYGFSEPAGQKEDTGDAEDGIPV